MNLDKQGKILALFDEGKYACSLNGDILGFSNNQGGLRTWGKVLKGYPTHRGYLLYNLVAESSKSVYALGHQLIMLWVTRGYEPHLQVNHIDGVKTNNNRENLELVTAKENKLHAFRIGLETQMGVDNSCAKLNEAKVMAIRQAYDNDLSIADLAQDFGVTYNTAHAAAVRKTWRHV